MEARLILDLVPMLVIRYQHPNPDLPRMSNPSLWILPDYQGAAAVGWNVWTFGNVSCVTATPMPRKVTEPN
jgi:hypothetical protein